MKLIINTAQQRFGGPVQGALSFINECKNFPKYEYHVFLGRGLKKVLNKKVFSTNFKFYDFDFGIINLRKTFKINNFLRKYEKKINPDCVITPVGPPYFNSDAPHIIGYNLGLYVYPESPYFKSLSFYRRCKFSLKKFLHFYFYKRDADAFVVQTADMNRRVKKALNADKVFTVTNTHSGYYKNWESYPKKLPAKKEERIRLLTLSSYYPHKDLELIPKIVEGLKKRGLTDIDFVLTLGENIFREKISKNGTDQIINIGPVPPNECPSLYAECDIMFLPSLAESFSASYPEAMVMEKPIITTNLGFAKSICEDAALYFNASNYEDAIKKIIKLKNDRSLQKRLIANGKRRVKDFDSPQERARKYLSLCDKMGNNNQKKDYENHKRTKNISPEIEI